jgi:hypothetical protein
LSSKGLKPADNVFVELSSYVQVVGVSQLASLGLHADWGV